MTSQKGRLAGKVAIVTGGGSGFGAAIATRFHQEGCSVLIGDLNESTACATSNALHSPSSTSTSTTPTALAIHMDVTQPAHWATAVEKCLQTWGRLDIVVNNAGTSYRNKPTLEVTEQEFQRCFDVNVKSVFHSVNAAVPALRKAGGGSVINISSIGSVRPRPGLVWYNASKGAVTNATKGLAAEFGPHNIRVNAIAPLLSNTGLFESFVGVPHTEENVKEFVKAVPLGRLTEPVDVANAALFLASDEGRFVTGTNWEIDGGKGI